jgi:Fe-S-cluster containining protein
MNSEELRPFRLPLPTIDPAEIAHQAVTSCEGCGVCCREQPFPPFLDDIDLIPLELQKEVIELQKREAELWQLAQPCTWLDPKTNKCIHHEYRPNICREYEVGGELCLEIRVKYRIG